MVRRREGILDDSERFNRLQNVYSAHDNRELASSYDEWAEDYEDDMLSLGYAIPAVAAGFVGRHVPVRGTVLDAGAGTGLFGSILRVLGYEDLVGIDISERMLEKAGEKDAYHSLHRMVLGEPLGFDAASFSAAVSVGVFTTNHAPPGVWFVEKTPTETAAEKEAASKPRGSPNTMRCRLW